MPITSIPGGGTVITGASISYVRLLTLRAGLKLEMKGLRRRGRSCYSILKSELNLRGSKARVLEQVNQLIATMQANPAVIQDSQ